MRCGSSSNATESSTTGYQPSKAHVRQQNQQVFIQIIYVYLFKTFIVLHSIEMKSQDSSFSNCFEMFHMLKFLSKVRLHKRKGRYHW